MAYQYLRICGYKFPAEFYFVYSDYTGETWFEGTYNECLNFLAEIRGQV